MKRETTVKIALAVLVIDLIFFLVLRTEFTDVYSNIVPSQIEGIVIIIGMVIAIISSTILLFTVYNTVKDLVR